MSSSGSILIVLSAELLVIVRKCGLNTATNVILIFSKIEVEIILVKYLKQTCERNLSNSHTSVQIFRNYLETMVILKCSVINIKSSEITMRLQ